MSCFSYLLTFGNPENKNLTSYYCSGSLKTHESEFCFSGLPKFDNQGCHISLGRNCPNSIPAQGDGQITTLKHTTVGIHGKFCCTFFTLVSWTVGSSPTTVGISQREIFYYREWSPCIPLLCGTTYKTVFLSRVVCFPMHLRRVRDVRPSSLRLRTRRRRRVM